MHYTIKAYIGTGIMDSLETQDFTKMTNFVWEHCQKGHDCELTDHNTGEVSWAYADNFTEETEAVEELFYNKKGD